MEELKSVWFAKIETEQQCLEIIRHISILFLIYSVFVAVTYLLTGSGPLVQGIIFAVLAVALRKWKSPAVSTALVLASVLFFVHGVLQIAGVIDFSRPNILILIVLAWGAYRAFLSTRKLKSGN